MRFANDKTAFKLKLKFNSPCVVCGTRMAQGDFAYFLPIARKVMHIECAAQVNGIEFSESNKIHQVLSPDQLSNVIADGAVKPEASITPPSDLAKLEHAMTKTFAVIERDIKRLDNDFNDLDASKANLRDLRALSDKVDRLLDAQPKVIEIIDAAGDYRRVDVGVQHKQFEQLLRACTARGADGNRLNIWLAGPAGSGKTTGAKTVAKVMNVPFYTNGALDQKYELKGFTDANGRIVSTQFREAWTKPSVYLFDEVDGSLNTALLPFNAALANGLADFPGDGLVPRHPDCIVIAAGNTWGLGGTAQYVGRMRLDAAFLDRFVQLDWDIDEGLETATVDNAEWCTYVQRVRKNVKSRGLQHMVTPRATYNGAALLAAGLDRKVVINMTLKRGLTDEQWREVQ